MKHIGEIIQKWRKEQRKVTKYFIRFCVFMLLCSMIARGIYAYRLPKVTIGSVEKKTINHVVKVDGNTQAMEENAVYAEPGIRVAGVYVTQGQQVQEGDSLFVLDVDDLRKKLEDKKEEAQSLQLQISAAQTNESIAQSLAARDKERAQQDYQDTVNDGETKITSSAEALQKAQEKQSQLLSLSDYMSKEKAKDTQLQSYKNSVDKTKEKKKKAQEDVEDEEKDLNSLRDELNDYKNNSSAVADDERNAHISELEKKIDEQEKNVDTAKDDASEKKAAYEDAKDDLESYESSLEITIKDSWQKEKEGLEDTVKDKTSTYQNTITEQLEQTNKAQRDIEDKNAQKTVDSALAVNQLSLQQKQEDINRYQALIDSNGVMKSEITGMVKKLSIGIGDTTAETAALILAQNGETFDFVANITKEEKKYMATGDKALVSFDDGRKECDDCEIYAIEPGTEQNTYQVHVKVPAKDLSWNQTGTLQVVKQSQSFDTCVPLQSMMADGSQYYCLILVEKTGFMGQEYAVEKRPVVMVDHNDTYAALENFSVSSEERVVLYSNRTLQSGDIVRLKES